MERKREGIFKYIFRLISSGKTFKDKFGIIIYWVGNYPLSKIFGYKAYLPWNVIVSHSGGNYFINRKTPGHLGSSSENYEPEVMENLNLKKGVFIDVGTHIGRFTIQIARQLKDKGEVIAFEPDNLNYEILLKNISLNKLMNVLPYNMAVSNKIGLAKFHILEEGSGGNSIVKDPKHTKGFELVKTTTIDEIVKNLKLKRIDTMKIDVEDAEIQVLKGAKESIKNFKPKIIFESYGKEKVQKNISMSFKVLSSVSVILGLSSVRSSLKAGWSDPSLISDFSALSNLLRIKLLLF